MLKAGITGNIGSGKTTVCKIFESLGIPVYYADPEARKFYRKPEVIRQVKELFGQEVFDEKNHLRNNVLAGIVFNDPSKLARLNAILHPLVLEDFLQWAHARENEDYLLYESALLFESGFHKHFNLSILVHAPEKLACKRVMDRDGITRTEFYERFSRQMPADKKIPQADFIIENDEATPLIPKAIDIHKQILSRI